MPGKLKDFPYFLNKEAHFEQTNIIIFGSSVFVVDVPDCLRRDGSGY